MTTFAEYVDDYLRLRRALGFKLTEHVRLLPKFAAHLDAIGVAYITVDLALGWAVEPTVPPGSVVPAMRLLVVRGFARYMSGIDPRTEVPPTGLIRLPRHRRPPFIYSDEQVLALMERARSGIRQRLVGATYETLIGLLAATGMRISEAIKLDDADIEWQQGVLLVRESKFNKSRYLPVQASTLDALERYAHERDRLCPNPRDRSFFVSLRRRRLDDCAVQRRSDGFVARPASGQARRSRHGCMTSGTRWRSRRCSAGTARASMSTRAFRHCRPISGT